MAIQLQLQQRNFGRPLESAAEFHRYLQLGNGQSSLLLSQECWSKSDSRIGNFVAEMSVDQIDRFIRLEVCTSISLRIFVSWKEVRSCCVCFLMICCFVVS